MIDFWARLDESDVEKYAKTLILPEYMSHLNLRPFLLSDQRKSASGREPLTLRYVGDGRLEELELEPEKDATPLIASLDLGVDPEKIRTPTSGACWTWSDYGPSHPFFSRPLDAEISDDAPSNDKKSPQFLRVYFEPRETTFAQTLTFEAQDAYVSVSRREIFFSWRVLQAYLKARCLDLLVSSRSSANVDIPTPEAARSVESNDVASLTAKAAPRVDFAWDADFRPFCENYAAPPVDADSPSSATDSKTDVYAPSAAESFLRSFVAAPAKNAPPPAFFFDYDDQNIRFQFGKIAGSLVVANGETFENALRFSKLDKTLTNLAQYVYYDPRNAAPSLDETGVRLRLTPVENGDALDAF